MLMGSSDGFTGPVNLGSPGELAEKVIDMTGSKSEIVNKPLPRDDPRQRKTEIPLAGKGLGWKPSLPLRMA